MAWWHIVARSVATPRVIVGHVPALVGPLWALISHPGGDVLAAASKNRHGALPRTVTPPDTPGPLVFQTLPQKSH
jgi:hypothetical protein